MVGSMFRAPCWHYLVALGCSSLPPLWDHRIFFSLSLPSTSPASFAPFSVLRVAGILALAAAWRK